MFTKFEDSSTDRSCADMMKINFGRREKWTNKTTDEQYATDSLYTVQLVIPDVVLNFKILGQVVAEKSLTEKKLTGKRIDKHANIIM